MYSGRKNRPLVNFAGCFFTLFYEGLSTTLNKILYRSKNINMKNIDVKNKNDPRFNSVNELCFNFDLSNLVKTCLLKTMNYHWI